MENPINMDDLGVPPWIGNLHRLSNMLVYHAEKKLRQRIGDVCLYAGLHRFPAVCDILLAEYREYLGWWTREITCRYW